MKKVVFAALVVCLFAATSFAAGPVKVGVMGPMTGKWASEGQEMKEVVALLADELNAKGGAGGMKFEIIVEDDAGDPRQAALAAQRLVTKGVAAVIGTYGSAVTEASQNIYSEAKVVQIATGSTAVRLTEKGLKLFFRTCPRDDEQGAVAVATIAKMGWKNVAILHDNTTYAKGLAEEAKGPLEKKGVKIVFYDALTPGQNDYTAILTKMKGANPDGIFFTGYYPEAGLLLKQAKQMNWKVPFMGGDACNNPDLVKIAGKDAAAGFYFLTAPLPKDLPTAKDFLASFKKKYNKEPASIYAVLAGDAFKVIAAAVEGTKSGEAAKIADFLHGKLMEYPGLTGKISFNDKGDRVGEVYRVYKVDGEGGFILQP